MPTTLLLSLNLLPLGILPNKQKQTRPLPSAASHAGDDPTTTMTDLRPAAPFSPGAAVRALLERERAADIDALVAAARVPDALVAPAATTFLFLRPPDGPGCRSRRRERRPQGARGLAGRHRRRTQNRRCALRRRSPSPGARRRGGLCRSAKGRLADEVERHRRALEELAAMSTRFI